MPPISPRRTCLHRVPDLAGFRSTLVDLVREVPPALTPDIFILVPSRAAGEQLRRTLEDQMVNEVGQALAIPGMGPRSDWYARLATRLSPAPRLLTGVEREVILAAAARAVEAEGLSPPFRLRPGLVAEMLALYDHIHRLCRTVDDFERNFQRELEKDVETDRGAERLLAQTDFLAAAFTEYDMQVARSGALDEPALRRRLFQEPSPRPLSRVIVSAGDRLADPDGLWPADFDLLTRVQGLAAIDLVCTEAMLASGLRERLHHALPGLEEVEARIGGTSRPVLQVPVDGAGPGGGVFLSRDREDELTAVARRIKADRRRGDATPLNHKALVVRQPLPYLYLAREVLDAAGIPFEALDTLPLAAEPYAAAVDVVLDSVSSAFTRRSLVALLSSPHFRFDAESTEAADRRSALAPVGVEIPSAPAVEPTPNRGEVNARAIQALDVALAEARYLGSLDRLESLHRDWSGAGPPSRRAERRRLDALSAMTAAVGVARKLAPLAERRPIVSQVETLLAVLRDIDRPTLPGDLEAARRLRVRAAVLGTLAALAAAYRRHDPDAEGDAATLSAAVRRWLGSRTFALTTGAPGLQIVDAQAARYGAFDEVQLVGLINGEWPEPTQRTVFYPASLMALLEPADRAFEIGRREREVVEGARAAFRDLLGLATRRLRLSTFLLEQDAIVESSMLLDEIAGANLTTETVADPDPARVFLHEAVTLDPPVPAALPPAAAAWARVRQEPRGEPARFRGASGPWTLPRVSVSRLERYLDCPFRFFASEVLGLEEEPEDEDARTPLERGRFLHELFERFFAEWQRRGHRRITVEALPAARALFEEVAEAALSTLPPAEAALERARLLGSAVSPGIAHRVLSLEAERGVDVVERLLELPLQGDFTFRASDGRTRTIALSAKTDRVDLLSNGSLRVIDYKSKLTPDVKQALQLPIYSLCARTRLAGHQGRDWTLGEAAYLSFEGERAIVPLRVRGRTLDDLVDDAQDRLLGTLDAIGAGVFPPRPARKSLCVACPYSTVCRREWEKDGDE
jgi:RecB family exonuclease